KGSERAIALYFILALKFVRNGLYRKELVWKYEGCLDNSFDSLYFDRYIIGFIDNLIKIY
ncbi:MAG TPA: hypothetical protein PLG11_08200, partial [Bacteroidales bacterium]|nr:hypothetical protein [Bacteroidales bacterium]HQB25896.1 hypothetical protein [Bacteroidales bacterium]